MDDGQRNYTGVMAKITWKQKSSQRNCRLAGLHQWKKKEEREGLLDVGTLMNSASIGARKELLSLPQRSGKGSVCKQD